MGVFMFGVIVGIAIILIESSIRKTLKLVYANDPDMLAKLEIPLYSFWAYYKFRKEQKSEY